MEVKGQCEKQFEPVKELFKNLHSSGQECGSAFSVYKDGRPIIDLWSGYVDVNKTKTWKKNTLATVWSTTKGVAALTSALAVERGLLDYDEKVL